MARENCKRGKCFFFIWHVKLSYTSMVMVCGADKRCREPSLFKSLIAFLSDYKFLILVLYYMFSKGEKFAEKETTARAPEDYGIVNKGKMGAINQDICSDLDFINYGEVTGEVKQHLRDCETSTSTSTSKSTSTSGFKNKTPTIKT